MKSKGGKVEYICPHCNSPKIMKMKSAINDDQEIHGYFNEKLNMFFCRGCRDSGYWNKKLNVSLKNPMPEVKQHMQVDNSVPFVVYTLKNVYYNDSKYDE